MFISIIMCTRNRAEQLRRVLETAAAMTVPEGLEWEMLLIDNGSTDKTPDVVASFKNRLPVKYIFEAEAGLSNARNRGVREAAGQYICWTDDDVMIDPDWLSAYASAFQKHPDAAVFGGVIEPVTEVPLPDWWLANQDMLATVLAARDFGRDEMALTVEGDRLPYGANFALRSHEQRQHLYDPALGVGPHHKRLGEESAVIRAIFAAGASGIWVPNSKVSHIIPSARITMEYVGVYYRSVGETWAYLSQNNRLNFMGSPIVGARRFDNVPIWIWKLAFKNWLGHTLSKTKTSASVMRHWLDLNYYMGAIGFLRRQGKGANDRGIG